MMDTVEKIAETVLYEGYLLYPYRRSTMKNQQRWTFGGVYPRAYSEANGSGDPWRMQTQCLLEGTADAQVEVKVRFLHVADRSVAEMTEGTLRLVESLRVGEQVYQPWEEAIEREMVVGGGALRLRDLANGERHFAIEIPAGREEEILFDAAGAAVGALIREWRPLQGGIEITAAPFETDSTHAHGTGPGYRLTVRISNITPWTGTAFDDERQTRSAAVRQAFISTHTILRVQEGQFVSLLEPPSAYQEAAGACQNLHTWPVLVGEPGERHTLLSSPIILYDYPQISPESPGDLFEGTEIDELLTLSILTLTDDEKQEMRETDARSRAILERTETLTPEQLLQMHGVIRSLQPLRKEMP